MTNELSVEEAIKMLKSKMDGHTDTSYEWAETVRMAIKALEQESILDKIRAEIDEYGSIMVAYAITEDTKTDKGIEKLVSGVLKEAKKQVLEIIDKYKTERREISMNKNPIDKYHAIKLIIDTAEEKIQGEFEECVQNNWMYDYTQFANNTRMQAYNEIEKMTKE